MYLDREGGTIVWKAISPSKAIHGCPKKHDRSREIGLVASAVGMDRMLCRSNVH
jgi:hypothetical protein